MKDCKYADTKPEPLTETVLSFKQMGFKNKSNNNNIPNSEKVYFKWLGFHIGRYRPKVYEKTIDRLALYISMQFKMGVTSWYAYIQKNMWRLRYLSCWRSLVTMTIEYGRTKCETT